VLRRGPGRQRLLVQARVVDRHRGAARQLGDDGRSSAPYRRPLPADTSSIEPKVTARATSGTHSAASGASRSSRARCSGRSCAAASTLRCTIGDASCGWPLRSVRDTSPSDSSTGAKRRTSASRSSRAGSACAVATRRTPPSVGSSRSTMQ
jgi:hypothetical protein